MNCHHCKAGKVALKPSYRVLESGVKLQVVQCLLCGWEVSRVAPQEPHRPAITRPAITRPAVTRAAAKKAPPWQRHPCTRVGCNGWYCANPSNKYHLCPDCAAKIYYWVKIGGEFPSAYLRQGDVWIDNPDYIAPSGRFPQKGRP